jgi:hypothetical protein
VILFEEWVDEVRTALGLEEEVDVDLILELARSVAHGIERRAAPVAAFLVGLAAGRAGGGRAAEADAAAKVRALVPGETSS